MTKNMGNPDRVVRLVVAAILFFLAFGTGFGSAGVLHWILLAVAAVMALTAALGNCPAYSIFGIRTCKSS